MSGIVGIYNIDGAPVDRDLLQRMTDVIADNGPDGVHHWVDGSVGIGHSMLQTTPESVYERQPLTDESGNLCLSMDGRVDNREELISTLKSEGARLRDDTDAELVLKAYESWGKDCPARIIGDFAFVIWDKRVRQLFCARDHLGVKALYYATVRNSVLFSNSVACLRTHPDITETLNERAIGDFLLFDCNMDLSTTTFADIKGLPPGHYLTCADGNQAVRRYWSLPVEDEIRYPQQRDYVDHFNILMQSAVRDRLRTNRAAVFMSGGLDSSSVAATACHVMGGNSETNLHAYTSVYDQLMPDRERYYSGLVARALGVPIHFLPQDGYPLYERAKQLQHRAADPMNEPFHAVTADQLKDIAQRSRVALTGDGGDPIFYGNSACLMEMLRSFRLGELIQSVAYVGLRYKKLPRLGFRTKLRRALGIAQPGRPAYPAWLNASFEARYELRARWRDKTADRGLVHPRRPESYECLNYPLWQQLFAAYSPELTGSPVEVRFAFFDLRLIRYMLRVPSLPWCSEKLILRVAMQSILPEQVRMRPKTTIVADPILVRLKSGDGSPLMCGPKVDRTSEYVDRKKLGHALSSADPETIWADVRPISLSYWLSSITNAN